MEILITGASGLIGTALTSALLSRGDSVVGVSRAPGRQTTEIRWVSWDDLGDAVESADAVVHLAGADIAAKRWTSQRKALLRSSRIETTERVVQAIAAVASKPAVLVSMSAVGYYGSRDAEELRESSPPGDDFLAQLCRDWEEAAQGAGTRTVLLRMGVVLSRAGGALPKLALPFRFGVGGPIGRGRHFMAWVHVRDALGVILHAIDTESVEGPLNVVAPDAVTNAAFSKALGRALHRPSLLPVPPAVLWLKLGEGLSVLTASQRVLPEAAQASGYAFSFPSVGAALGDLYP